MSDETTENMTDEQNTAQEAAGAPETTQEETEVHGDVEAQEGAQDPEKQQEQDEQQNPNAEAKRYRLRLRDAEAELESTRTAIAALQEQVLSTALGDGIDVAPDTSKNHAVDPDTLQPKPITVSLLHPDDLFSIGGVDKAELFTDGALDQAKLSQAVGQLHITRPELFREGRHGDPIHQPVPTAGNQPDTQAAIKRALEGGGGWQGVIQNRG
ncbi:hypothetical protein GCM10027060_18850 [Nesterenkonia halophila]|uniref:hypothetical protein n=1 Tax=Nesterenkonia halophila TaxID=302044 RepID=UPI0012924577|nr:hypothetical protein [Nesterenkonia halophila]